MNQIQGILGVSDIFTKPTEKGVAKISQITFKESENPLFNLRILRDTGSEMFTMVEGKYVRLHINGELMMSDTKMERISNKPLINKARGRVLICGLGIGMVLRNILDKKEIQEVVVLEKYQDVIDLVSPKFKHPKLKIICSDCFKYKPSKKEQYDTIYFDIWATISEDNLDEMELLEKKYKKNLKKNGWMDSWMKKFLQNRQENG